MHSRDERKRSAESGLFSLRLWLGLIVFGAVMLVALVHPHLLGGETRGVPNHILFASLAPAATPTPPCTDDTWTATGIANAPTSRSVHTAVWTGSEMIVWGGFDGTNYLNTGGRYCAQSGAPTATPTSTPTPTVWPSVTPRPRPTSPPRSTRPPRPTPPR